MQIQDLMENVKMKYSFLDEFANLGENAIKDFNIKISTVRSRRYFFNTNFPKCSVKL